MNHMCLMWFNKEPSTRWEHSSLSSELVSHGQEVYVSLFSSLYCIWNDSPKSVCLSTQINQSLNEDWILTFSHGRFKSNSIHWLSLAASRRSKISDPHLKFWFRLDRPSMETALSVSDAFEKVIKEMERDRRFSHRFKTRPSGYKSFKVLKIMVIMLMGMTLCDMVRLAIWQPLNHWLRFRDEHLPVTLLQQECLLLIGIPLQAVFIWLSIKVII